MRWGECHNCGSERWLKEEQCQACRDAERIAVLEARVSALESKNEQLHELMRSTLHDDVAALDRLAALEEENDALRKQVASLSKHDPKQVRPAALANDLMELTALAAGGDA